MTLLRPSGFAGPALRSLGEGELGLSLIGRNLRLARPDGLPGGVLTPAGLAYLSRMSQPPVVMVHGFRYHPGAPDSDNPHRTTFRHWRADILAGRPTIGLGWWSCPGDGFSPLRHIGSVASAWAHGQYNTYRYAWDLAAQAGAALGEVLGVAGPCDMLAHSLGSRVALAALRARMDAPVRRVVLLNGAELSRTALETAVARPDVDFVNFVVATDNVLRLFGGLFAPGNLYARTVGQAGLGEAAPANWRDIQLDSPRFRAWAAGHGWPDVRGDDPRGVLDHWYTHKHPGNWPLIRAALDGRLPVDLERLARNYSASSTTTSA
jgi:hypothetical protein